MKQIIKDFSLSFLMWTVFFAIALSMTSCKSGWDCKKRYVYVPMNKEYIQKHQQGADSFDKIMLSKKVKP